MSHNLADRPQAERVDLEIDKARWFVAHTWLKKLPPREIRERLERIEKTEEREDMRRRLNEMRSLPRYAKTSR